MRETGYMSKREKKRREGYMRRDALLEQDKDKEDERKEQNTETVRISPAVSDL